MILDFQARVVEFLEDACEHVCFKGQRDDRYNRLPRLWAQGRAERIPWIETALTAPRELRWSHQNSENQVYLAITESGTPAGQGWERFGVYVRPISQTRVQFVTAFPMDKPYWDEARRQGRPIYPAPKQKRRR